ncbi:hypothetical protein LshimejAT787_0502040 [Lyophyllum shimeji]|uniref:Uncharacterized protein n=1 Tax=Lyophyllum shimeji TaxID=47721 RepID=A0A9P3PMV1_LYOSH|nr:hypothetical protein LshimejAT787_0502040 [Lyophyllum shimeji]
METIRKRVPFRHPEADRLEEDEKVILDEQEQDSVIQKLKETNKAATEQYMFVLQVILVLSFTLQLLSFYTNPLLIMIPEGTPEPAFDIPLPAAFTFLNLIVHISLALIAFRETLTTQYNLSEAATNLVPFQACYAIAAVPLTLSMFLRGSWQSMVWWGLTLLVVFTVQTVLASIDQGNESISELENLRYVSPGA